MLASYLELTSYLKLSPIYGLDIVQEILATHGQKMGDMKFAALHHNVKWSRCTPTLLDVQTLSNIARENKSDLVTPAWSQQKDSFSQNLHLSVLNDHKRIYPLNESVLCHS